MDDLSSPAETDRENEANAFAQEILHIDNLDEFSDSVIYRETQVREAAAQYRVHPAVILGALQKKSGNFRSYKFGWKRKRNSAVKRRLGYRHHLAYREKRGRNRRLLFRRKPCGRIACLCFVRRHFSFGQNCGHLGKIA